MHDVLVLFTRFPIAGQAKTRMIPALGAEGAAALHAMMTRLTTQLVTTGARRVHFEVRYTGADEEALRAWLGHDLHYAPQGEGDLGERMRRAFDQHFAAGAQRVLLIGSDCPGLDHAAVQDAFDALRHNALVLGPALDGGYYLIGMHCRARDKDLAALFANTAWGSDSVRASTLSNAQALGLRVGLLDALPDVDVPEDLPVWEAARALWRISVIIPAFNEAKTIAVTLASASVGLETEVILVDGGSEDDTVATAKAAGCIVLHAPRGRAAQMNAGAAQASGGILLFLHADTRLPPNFDAAVRRLLVDPSVALGAFGLHIEGAAKAYRRIGYWATLRSRWLGLAYGDQGMFLRREDFNKLGGFADTGFMEDVELVTRARRLGRVVTLPESVATSARRWERNGVARVTLLNLLAISAYVLGVPPRVIQHYYRGGMDKQG